MGKTKQSIMTILIKQSILFVLLFFTLQLFAQTINKQKIDSIILSTMQQHKIIGVSLGIVKDGKIIYTKGYGTTKVGTFNTIDSTTNFLTCSISKLFTATAIMQLVEQGKIDISKKLTDYIPDFVMKDKRYKDITIEQMLTHTSGLPNIANRHFIHPKHDSVALKDFVKKLGRKRLSFMPGVQLSAKTYSNTAYDVLGRVIENVTHQTYADYVSQNILQPVGMQLSSFFIDSIPVKRRSIPHVQNWLTMKVRATDYYPDIPQDKPCGNLNACTNDLCKWMLHNLAIKDNKINGVLKNSTLKIMWSIHKNIPPYKTSIGLGWWIFQSDKYGKYVFHVGNDPGYSATLVISPDNNFGVVILCNGEYPRQIIWNKLPFKIMDTFGSNWKK